MTNEPTITLPSPKEIHDRILSKVKKTVHDALQDFKEKMTEGEIIEGKPHAPLIAGEKLPRPKASMQFQSNPLEVPNTISSDLHGFFMERVVFELQSILEDDTWEVSHRTEKEGLTFNEDKGFQFCLILTEKE